MHTSARYPFALMMAALLTAAPALAQPPAERLLLEVTPGAAPRDIPGHAVRDRVQAGQANPSAFRAGRIVVDLPDGRQLSADRTHEERGARGEVTWVGEVDDAPGSLLVITRHRGVVTGFLHHGAETYELGVSADGRSVLFQVDDAALPDEGEPVSVTDDSFEAAVEAAAAEASAAGDVVVQDILLVYTAKAVTRAGSAATLESKILNAVAAANSAYVSSAVNIRLNVVGLAQTNYAETGDMALTLSRLRSTSDGYMDEVHTWRNQAGADLVALVSDDSGYCGYGYVMSTVSSSFASSAFTVTVQNCFSNQTLAHEIGHNQGNSHDRVNGGSSAYPYSFGYRTCDNVAYTNGQSFRTVMGYSCSSSPRVNSFSNPNIYYNGAPMGVDYETSPSTAADNARSMNNTAAVTAAFRSPPATSAPVAPTGLTGSATAHDSVSLSWSDQSSDASGFTLERAVGTGSFTTRATLASNTNSFVDTGLTAQTTYHYRLRAYNSAGVSVWSGTVSVTAPAASAVPASPTPASLALSGTTAAATWTNVSGESSYRVVRETYNSRRKRWSSTSYTVAANVTSFSQNLNAGTYRYRVSAVSAAGTSAAVVAAAVGSSDGSFVVGGTSAKDGGGSKDSGSGKGKP